jgi:ribonuclease E
LTDTAAADGTFGSKRGLSPQKGLNMSKKMLINALHPEEARVAIVEDGRLVELDIEIAGSEQTRGNIYKGVVVRVEPGLQAAFVDIGLKKLGFLQMGELHPENWLWRDDVPPEQRNRRPRIQEILRRGQELIVQVEKGERDNKGAALTSYVSLPGRYMVLMPGSDSSGISRKVEKEGDRKKLKELIAELTIPEGIGYIIRTEAVGRTKAELTKDLEYLLKTYKGITDKGAAVKGPALIYEESELVIRTIRDYFSAEIDEILVDSKEVYQQARAFLKGIKAKYVDLVKMHQEKRPIFSRYQLEEQIDLIYEKKVPLKSGGSIFIEPTEALVSIDVNSGKSTGEKGVEDTAFKTNLEAAEEAARQLRLRDLGGLIVIDFIDMRDRKHNAEVEKTLKTALKADKARVNVARISEFGLLEMSRQRIRQILNQGSMLECSHCEGRGKVKSVEAMALSFLRKVHAAAAKGTVAEVHGALPLEVAYYLLNRKKRELAQIENDYDIEVTVKGKPSFLLNQLEIELVKREKPLVEEQVPEKTAPAEAKAEKQAALQETPVSAEEEKAKKKRRRGKKKPAGEGEAATAEELLPTVEEAVAVIPAPVAETLAVGEQPVAGEALPEEHKKKRRRRKKRGSKAATPEAGTAEAALVPVAVGESAAVAAVDQQVVAGADSPAEEVKKKRRRKRRRSAKPAVDGEIAGDSLSGQIVVAATVGTIVETASQIMAEPGARQEKAKTRPSRPKKKAEAAPLVETSVPPETSPLAAEPVAKAKPRRAPRPEKLAAVTVPAEKTPAVPTPAAVPASGEALAAPKKRAPAKKRTAAPVTTALIPESAAEPAKKPARKRAPRKKKEETATE